MGELDQRILRLAVPNLLAAVSIPLIGIVDTALIGHLPKVAFLGAVATASVIFDVLFWGTGFLRMATTSIVSHHHGAGDPVLDHSRGRLDQYPRTPVVRSDRGPGPRLRCRYGK